jgi:hypothetical protein
MDQPTQELHLGTRMDFRGRSRSPAIGDWRHYGGPEGTRAGMAGFVSITVVLERTVNPYCMTPLMAELDAVDNPPDARDQDRETDLARASSDRTRSTGGGPWPVRSCLSSS